MDQLTVEELKKLFDAFNGYPHIRLLVGYMAKQSDLKKIKESVALLRELQMVALTIQTDKQLFDSTIHCLRSYEHGNGAPALAGEMADVIDQWLKTKTKPGEYLSETCNQPK